MIIRDLGKVDYLTAWQVMIDFTKKRDQTTEDEFWICEHLPVFTLGTSLKNSILPIRGIRCINTDRGGKITYHGPGQLVGYPLMDLRKNNLYPKELLDLINRTVLSVMREFGIEGLLVPEAPGIYVSKPGGANQFFNLAKICSIGLKISNHSSYHGFALNVSADLEPFSYINPCGYEGLRIVNLNEIAQNATLESAKIVLVEKIKEQFREKRS